MLLQVRLDDVLPGSLVQPVEDGRSRDGAELFELPPSQEPNGLAFHRAVDNGGSLRAGILFLEFERPGAHIVSPADPDGNALFRHPASLAESPYLISRSAQVEEGSIGIGRILLGTGPRADVVTVD